jgi:tetratricopeptide (TPR) repeat protein
LELQKKKLKMKKLILLLSISMGFAVNAQTNQQLLEHFEAYYKQMKSQGDIQGIINGLTHLNILSPSETRKDTLAYFYMKDGKYAQALNTIGVDVNEADTDMAVEIKAVSLKTLNKPKLALKQFQVLFERTQNVTVAYELAELNIQNQDLGQASELVEYGLLHVQDNMLKPYFEMQQPYQVPLRAGFLYLKALIIFNQNKATNIDEAVAYLEQAITLAPNFNLAYVSRDALLGQKAQPPKTD